MAILTSEFANKFIREIVSNLPYNVNIMNEKGIIIASKDAKRVGDFHEVAYGLLNGTLESGVVTEDNHYIGTKPGINMLIDFQNRHVGVICVTGEPQSIETFAGFVKTSMEKMLDYEIRMSQENRTTDKKEKFLNYILFEQNFQQDIALELAKKIGVKTMPPACILFLSITPDAAESTIIRALTYESDSRYPNIAIKSRVYDYLVLKFLKSDFPVGNIGEFRRNILEYINKAASNFPDEIDLDSVSYHVGSLQLKLGDYRKSFQHAQHLHLHTGYRNGIFFFYDHIRDFIRYSVPMNLYQDVFGAIGTIFRAEERVLIAKTIKTLAEYNYRIVETSRALNVHRNTVMTRLNKIKQMLNIDPMSSGSDRDFLNELAYYLTNVQ